MSGSEHALPTKSVAATSAKDPLFEEEASGVKGQPGPSFVDEADYNADIDDIDDDNEEYGPEEMTDEVGYVRVTEATEGTSNNDLDEFTQHLRRLHRQDTERNELFTHLHQENIALKRALKDRVPGGNPRADAAERSLFEIRRTLENHPYVCVLIDGKGYKIHEDLLQLGKSGGTEAAKRIKTELSQYLEQFSDGTHWEIMVYLYIDIGGLLARSVTIDAPLSGDNVRDFMVGFTQNQPLFTAMDVGHDSVTLEKMKAMFHLFADNIQCKHLIFGCCHNSAYAVALEKYASNPITASRITLLKSYEDNTYFESLPFESVEFRSVFRSTPFKPTDRLGEDIDYMQDFPRPSGSGDLARNSTNEVTEETRALARWQAASNAAIPLPIRHLRPMNSNSTWGSTQTVLLNINDARVDPPLLDEDYDTSEDMKDRMEVKRFCHFYHLQNSCISPGCNFRHGPKLNPKEMVVLRNYVRWLPCGAGSKCRRRECVFGHHCHDQPGCTKGARCLLYKFHHVDSTVVKLWQAETNTSPRRSRNS